MQLNKPQSYPDFALNLVNNRPNNQPNKVAPDSDKILNGYKYGDIPASEIVNYQENLSGQWIRYFDSLPSTDPNSTNTVVQLDQNGIANIQNLAVKSIQNANIKANSILTTDQNNLLSSTSFDVNASANSIALRDVNGNINAKNISNLSIQSQKNFDDINTNGVGISDRLAALERKYNDYINTHKAKLIQVQNPLYVGQSYDINYKFDMLKGRSYIISAVGAFQKNLESGSYMRVCLIQNGGTYPDPSNPAACSIIDYNTQNFNYFNAQTLWQPDYDSLNLGFRILNSSNTTLSLRLFKILICDVTGIIETINV